MSVSAARRDRDWHSPPVPLMKPTDTLPALVASFMDDGSYAGELLAEFMRHVATVARPYPAAYFALSDKSEMAVDDLGNRAFTICARVEKGRFPFEGRVPFDCFVAEVMDGRTIRYHSFYAKLSITREVLRDDYARNICRDPVLRWQADLYSSIGQVLKSQCTAVPQGRGVPPKWTIETMGLRVMQPQGVVEARLRASEDHSVEALVLMALKMTGGMSQSQLTNLLASVLPAPATEEAPADSPDEIMADRMDIRSAVAQAWADLEALDQHLIIALARGDAYEDLIARDPRLSHKVAVSRAVARVGQKFLKQVVDQMGLPANPNMTPRTMMEPIIGVLVDLYPSEFEGVTS